MSGQQTGNVFNIQHYCYQDGPGVRTTVFLKGCSLNCKWCGNPEGICRKSQLSYDPKECIGAKDCGCCLKSDRGKEILTVENGHIRILWEKVREEDSRLAKVCPFQAFSIYGKQMTPGEVIDEVNKDHAFYKGNGGGITLSGGEPLLQPEFAGKVFELAHENGFTTAIETAGNVPWEAMASVFSQADTIIHDIKMMDCEKHRKWTGADNQRILDNYLKAYCEFPKKTFIARTPVIPGVNDTEEDIGEIIDFLLPHHNVIRYELMPYHTLGLMKYESLGLTYPMEEGARLENGRIEKLRQLVEQRFTAERKLAQK